VLRASDQSLDVSIADMRLWKHGSVIRCVVPRGQVLVDVTLTPTVGPWRQGSGRVELGAPDDSWNWMMNVPRGRLSGKVTVGGRTFDAAGWGYLDHSWSNRAFFDFSRHWITLRYFSPKGSLTLFQMLPSEDLGETPVNNLAMSNDGRPVGSTDDVRVSFADWRQATDYRIPTAITAKGRVGETDVTIEAANGRLGETSDPLRSLPEIERQVIRLLVAKPMVFRVVLDIKVTRTENGISDVEQGRAIASMLFFDQ
jgi:predicted secreted hydrolase